MRVDGQVRCFPQTIALHPYLISLLVSIVLKIATGGIAIRCTKWPEVGVTAAGNGRWEGPRQSVCGLLSSNVTEGFVGGGS